MVWVMRGLRPQGFTLIELMVVMALVGVLVASIYQFFARTSEAMYEADSLADTTDRARFALEVVARDFQSAASFGTPDSGALGGGANPPDVWINRTQTSAQNYRIRGLIQIPGNQDRRLVAQYAPGADTNNPGATVDEAILVGAYDFPFTFEVSDVRLGGSGSVRLDDTPRGYQRFGRLDPFDLSNTAAVSGARDASLRNHARILRVMDRNGYLQFSLVGAMQNPPTPSARPGGFTQELTLSGPALMTRKGNDLWGLEPAGSPDDGYDAALLDVIRYRVCRDPLDGTNLKLVRERLLPQPFIAATNIMVGLPPERCGVAEPGVTVPNSQIPLVERVVDFQVWYDCVPETGNIQIPWETRWMMDASVDATAGHSCVLTTGAEQPGRARMAHIRLSVRTEDERRDVPHYGFVDLTTGAQVLDPATNPNVGSMQTYDIDNDPATSTRVMTFQVDVELPNFGMRTPTER
jgi:prepilin-type N-terminal cleavage/methylation domain-containing protein